MAEADDSSLSFTDDAASPHIIFAACHFFSFDGFRHFSIL